MIIECAGVGQRELIQVVNQALEVTRLQTFDRLLIHGANSILHGLEFGAQCSDGRSQFMGDISRHGLTDLLIPFQRVGKAVEIAGERAQFVATQRRQTVAKVAIGQCSCASAAAGCSCRSRK